MGNKPYYGEEGIKDIPEVKHGVVIPPKLSQLRRKLSQKAKQEPKFKFYTLYDRIYRRDTLETAWKLVKSNKGVGGVDKETIDEIEKSPLGVEKFIDEVEELLKTKEYRPSPVLRVYIPKGYGKKRPLGIPTVRDRVVQMATYLLLEPIFEADFLECSYGFRTGRNAHQALDKIRQHLKEGFTAVYDADIESYFDSIPHDKLMACFRMRIADRTVLKLIKMWLRTPVIDETNKGNPPKRPKKGTPQGGVLSPLLANVYLHWFDKAFHGRDGIRDAKLVRYADDFVILGRDISKQTDEWVKRKIEGWLELSINKEKTRVVDLRQNGNTLNFLGFTFRFDKDLKGRDRRYLNVYPSKESCAKGRGILKGMTNSRHSFTPIPELIERINKHLLGWKNYFDYGYPRKEFRKINWYILNRLTRHLNRRSQRGYRPPKGKSYYRHLRELGLIYL